MITLPKQVEYSLMVLSEMQAGEPGQLFSVRSLCDKLGVPFDVTSKAMQRLNRAAVLRSVQGKHGGYQLIRDLGRVTLAELMDVVVGPNAVAACLQDGQVCRHAGRCTIRKAVRRLDERVKDLYRETTLTDLVG